MRRENGAQRQRLLEHGRERGFSARLRLLAAGFLSINPGSSSSHALICSHSALMWNSCGRTGSRQYLDRRRPEPFSSATRRLAAVLSYFAFVLTCCSFYAIKALEHAVLQFCCPVRLQDAIAAPPKATRRFAAVLSYFSTSGAIKLTCCCCTLPKALGTVVLQLCGRSGRETPPRPHRRHLRCSLSLLHLLQLVVPSPAAEKLALG